MNCRGSRRCHRLRLAAFASSSSRFCAEGPVRRLDRLHPHPRDRLPLTFDERTHVFEYEGSRRRIVSVTTYAKQFCRAFDADEVLDAEYHKWQREEHPKYRGMTREAIRDLWAREGRHAREHGTAVHKAIEQLLNGEEVDPRLRGAPEIEQMQQFLEDQDIVPYRSEWVLFHEEMRCARNAGAVARGGGAPVSSAPRAPGYARGGGGAPRTSPQNASLALLEFFPEPNHIRLLIERFCCLI